MNANNILDGTIISLGVLNAINIIHATKTLKKNYGVENKMKINILNDEALEALIFSKITDEDKKNLQKITDKILTGMLKKAELMKQIREEIGAQ